MRSNDIRKQIKDTLVYQTKHISEYSEGMVNLIVNVNNTVDSLEALVAELVRSAENRVADNALIIAEYWINEDGRPKHLLQDLWDVKDVSVLDHIDKKYIDMYTGFNAKQT